MKTYAIACAAAALLTVSCSSVSPVAIHEGEQCFRCRRSIAEKAMAIAADICIYTNSNIVVEEL